jgi:hypothetical protein
MSNYPRLFGYLIGLSIGIPFGFQLAEWFS